MLLFALALGTVPAEAPPPVGPFDSAEILVTFAARTNPGGGFIGAEAGWDLAPGWSSGGYLNYYYYWAEAGGWLRQTLLQGFMINTLSLGVEPGEYVHADDGLTLLDARDNPPRRAGFRSVLRARSQLNFRPGWYWLYNRFTVEGRLRTFEELDPFRDGQFQTELTVEEAFAPMLRLATWSRGGALWAYTEITVSAEVSFGLLDLRPSAGVIIENLVPGLIINLDAYYGLRQDSAVEGFGVLAYVWWWPGK